jgi:uncharacterized SAM-dependent methyltransferase
LKQIISIWWIYIVVRANEEIKKMKHKDNLKHLFLKSRVSYSKQTDTNYIWYDMPYHLYLEPKQADAYIEMIEKDNFSESLHKPIVSMVQDYANVLINDRYSKIELYDLGPGLPIKTVPLIKNLQKKNIQFTYHPVDISQSFLRITKDYVRQFNIETKPINCLFEELPERLEPNYNSKTQRIFLIGLTFNNYRPNSILPLLKSMMFNQDVSLIITEFYNKAKLESILTPYQDYYAEQFNWLALKLIGCNRNDFQYETEFRNKRIQMGFRPKKKLEIYGRKLTKKHKIITAISYRYTEFSLTAAIQKHFKHFERLQKDQLAIYLLKE